MISNWIEALRSSDCREGELREVVVADHILAIARIDGVVYAMDGICPHQGGPLGQGSLCGHTVTCPWHGWQFDMRDGSHTVTRQLRQSQWETREQDGFVWVAPTNNEVDS